MLILMNRGIYKMAGELTGIKRLWPDRCIVRSWSSEREVLYRCTYNLKEKKKKTKKTCCADWFLETAGRSILISSTVCGLVLDQLCWRKRLKVWLFDKIVRTYTYVLRRFETFAYILVNTRYFNYSQYEKKVNNFFFSPFMWRPKPTPLI